MKSLSVIITFIGFLECTIKIIDASSEALILTDLIKQGHIEQARISSRVDSKRFLGVNSHSGFLTVDEKYNSNLFFWYFPIEENVSTTPWIIWLQGGPGSTSLFGLFGEIGPFVYKDSLKLREWSWTKHYSVLFIDNPVGSGFSFTNDDRGYAKNMSMYADHLYKAVQQFLTIFPELREAPLYIAGESYAGRYVPALAMEIHKLKTPNNDINLQGLIMGNPVLERENIWNISRIYYSWGLIDDQGLANAKPIQDAFIKAVISEDYTNAHAFWFTLLDYLDDVTGLTQSYNILNDNTNFQQFAPFLTKDVKEAIHVGNSEFTFSNLVVKQNLLPDFLVHTRPIVESLLENYRVLIYCGQLDLVAPCTPNASARRRTWRWSRRDSFILSRRIPWTYNGTIAGYVKSGGGLTEVLVRGAGHMTPIDKPEATLTAIDTFIKNSSFNILPEFSSNSPNSHLSPPFQVLSLESVEHTGIPPSVIIMTVSLIVNLFLIGALVLWFVRKRLLARYRDDSWVYNVVDDSVHSNILEII